MIALVEGAVRQKTPNEIALNILLAGMTLIFVFATVTIPSFVAYAKGAVSVVVLIALFVCLITTSPSLKRMPIISACAGKCCASPVFKRGERS